MRIRLNFFFAALATTTLCLSGLAALIPISAVATAPTLTASIR
jgi:hypothetical protein